MTEKAMRLRVLDLNTPWFWLTIFYQELYGKPWLEVLFWKPNTWKRWWINIWQHEQLPDERGQYECPTERSEESK